MKNLVKKFFVILSLSLLSVSALVGCAKGESEDDFMHEIYNKAKEAGYKESFETWASSIRGDKGANGAGIKTISFKEVKDGKTYYTVSLTDGTSYDVDIKNPLDGDKGEKGDAGDKGAKGDTGDKGPKGDRGVDNLSTNYATYKEKYGYVGTEEEFYKDFAKGELGYKKEYKVNIYLMDSVNEEYIETVSLNNVYKNGEKIDLANLDFGITKRIFFAADNFNKEAFYYNQIASLRLIDFNDYRAHSDTNILIGCYEQGLYFKNDISVYNKGFKVELGFSDDFRHLDWIPLDKSEYGNIKWQIRYNYPKINLTYNENTGILTSDKPGSCYIDLLYKGHVFENYLHFNEKEEVKPDLGEYKFELIKDPYYDKVRQSLQVGDFVFLEDELNVNMQDNYTVGKMKLYKFHDQYGRVRSFNYKLKNNTGIIEIYDNNMYAVKPGEDVLIYQDFKGEHLVEMPIKVYGKGEVVPQPVKPNSIKGEIYNKGDIFEGQNVILRLIDYKFNFDEPTNYYYIYIYENDEEILDYDCVLDQKNNSLSIKGLRAGTYDIVFEDNSRICKLSVTIKPKNI